MRHTKENKEEEEEEKKNEKFRFSIKNYINSSKNEEIKSQNQHPLQMEKSNKKKVGRCEYNVEIGACQTGATKQR